MSKTRYIERPPRLQPNYPSGEFPIPEPPGESSTPRRPLVQIFLPLVTVTGYVLLSITGQGRNLLLMIPMGISVLASVGMALYSRFKSTKKMGEQQASYTKQLVKIRKEIMTQHDAQRKFYLHNYPGPEKALEIAYEAYRQGLDVSPNEHISTRLWERRPSDHDFGALRLGLGARPSSTLHQLAHHREGNSKLWQEAKQLAEESRHLTDVPVTIHMRKLTDSPSDKDSSVHAIGIVGRDSTEVRGFVNALLVDLTAFHTPDEVHVRVLGTDQSRSAWRWLGRLPHCQSENPDQALCFESERDRAGNPSLNKVNLFLRYLRQELEIRQSRARDKKKQESLQFPLLIVVLDLLDCSQERSALESLESDPGVSLLIDKGDQLEAGVLFLVSKYGKVPGGCQAVIGLTANKPKPDDLNSTSVSFTYREVGVNKPHFTGKADLITNSQALVQFTQYLEPLRVRRSYGAGLPRSVFMLNMLKARTISELRQNILRNWQIGMLADHADWLEAPIGMLSGGDIRSLKFSAKADGVHGLIAGSTGSGKSELLMTMILSLAYHYDPRIVNFVLVDFKGGAAFEPFRKLPHCVDIVTNLRGSAVARMFAAIMAEIHRREAINVATGSKHIVHYRKNGLHKPPYGSPVKIKEETHVTAPYPHLFIFIDEFAEMIAENPEYRAQLNSITRLGRALGITLILAAQRPTGVTDQMRANIKFRIALRVETREESSEVLRRPDAAYLPAGIPGRGYLQVGNENIELIQIAWTGSEFHGGVEQKRPNVIWHDRQKMISKSTMDESPKVYEVLVNLMADMARDHSLPQRTPWPDFLPETLTLQTPLDTSYLNPEGFNLLYAGMGDSPESEDGSTSKDTDKKYLLPLQPSVSCWMEGKGKWSPVDWKNTAMRAPIGIIDNPHQAEQQPLFVDLRQGHAVVFGAPGWGKTTFLRTLISSLAVNHSPSDLHIYLLDFGGRQLSVFREMPHVGAIITAEEEERVRRLLRHLDLVLEQRKNILSEAQTDDVYQYNNQHPDNPLPPILVVIDNFAEFREGFDNLMPALVSLVRESRAYGFHFALSAELPSSLGGKLYSLITARFTLKLADPTEYTGIVGRGARVIEDIPGRGFVRIDRRALEFQTALTVGVESGIQHDDGTQKLAALVDIFHTQIDGIEQDNLPPKIHTLASHVSLASLIPMEPIAKASLKPALGVEDRTLSPWLLDLPGQGPHCMVIGPPSSGKTTTLRSLIISVASCHRPEDVSLVLIDYQQRLFRSGGQHSLGDLPHVRSVIANNDELDDLIQDLQTICPSLLDHQHSIVIVIDNYDTFANEARNSRTALPELAALAREWGTDGLHFVVAGSPSITRSPEDLRKQIQMPRLGIALQSEEAVMALNGRIPRSLVRTELPLGRGFTVRSGRTQMLQIATPYKDEEHQAESLNLWVAGIIQQYPEQISPSGSRPDVAGPPKKASAESQEKTEPDAKSNTKKTQSIITNGNQESNTRTDGRERLTEVPEGVDIQALREAVQDHGMPEGLLAMMSPIDLVNAALELDLLSLEDPE